LQLIHSYRLLIKILSSSVHSSKLRRRAFAWYNVKIRVYYRCPVWKTKSWLKKVDSICLLLTNSLNNEKTVIDHDLKIRSNLGLLHTSELSGSLMLPLELLPDFVLDRTRQASSMTRQTNSWIPTHSCRLARSPNADLTADDII